MELLEVVCGNGLERGLGPLHIPEPTSLAMTNSEGNPSLPPSSHASVDLRLGAAMRGDLRPIVIYVVEGLGAQVVGRRRGEDGSEA